MSSAYQPFALLFVFLQLAQCVTHQMSFLESVAHNWAGLVIDSSSGMPFDVYNSWYISYDQHASRREAVDSEGFCGDTCRWDIDLYNPDNWISSVCFVNGTDCYCTKYNPRDGPGALAWVSTVSSDLAKSLLYNHTTSDGHMIFSAGGQSNTSNWSVSAAIRKGNNIPAWFRGFSQDTFRKTVWNYTVVNSYVLTVPSTKFDLDCKHWSK